MFNDEKSSENEVYKKLMRAIKLPRIELHIIAKRDLRAYEMSKWMKTIREEGIKIL